MPNGQSRDAWMAVFSCFVDQKFPNLQKKKMQYHPDVEIVHRKDLARTLFNVDIKRAADAIRELIFCVFKDDIDGLNAMAWDGAYKASRKRGVPTTGQLEAVRAETGLPSRRDDACWEYYGQRFETETWSTPYNWHDSRWYQSRWQNSSSSQSSNWNPSQPWWQSQNWGNRDRYY